MILLRGPTSQRVPNFLKAFLLISLISSLGTFSLSLSLSLSLSHLTRRILCKILSQPPPSHRTFVRRVISSAEMVRGKYLIIGYYKQLSRILSKYGWVEAVSPPLSLHSKRSAHQSDSYDIFFVVNSWI